MSGGVKNYIFNLSVSLSIVLLLQVNIIEASQRVGSQADRYKSKEERSEVALKKKFPSFMRFLDSLDFFRNLKNTERENRYFIPHEKYFEPDEEFWTDFFSAAAEDQITWIRVFSLFARKVKEEQITVFGSGQPFTNAIKKLDLDIGLGLPIDKIIAAAWIPLLKNDESEFQCRLIVFYSESYTHRFPDDVLKLNLSLGGDKKKSFCLNTEQCIGSTVEADIFFGTKNGIGFKNIRGISGQKRSFLGYLLSFLPKGISGLVFDEKTDTLIVNAILDKTVEYYEKEPKFSIRYRDLSKRNEKIDKSE